MKYNRPPWRDGGLRFILVIDGATGKSAGVYSAVERASCPFTTGERKPALASTM